MEQTPAARFVEVLGRLGYKTQVQIAALLEIARPTAGTIVRQEREPSFADVAKLKNAHDEVNIDWIFTGKGNALDRNLTPAATLKDTEKPEAAAAPKPGLISGPATVAEAENILLRELLASKDVVIAMLKDELGKSTDSSDAAGPITPTPRKPISGFMTEAQRQEIAEAFNEVVEEELSEGSAVVVRR